VAYKLFLFLITKWKKIKEIKVPYIKMDSVEEFEGLDSPEFENVFVVTDFQDSVFNDLYKTDCRIIGPPVVLNCAQKGEVRTIYIYYDFLIMNFMKIRKQKNLLIIYSM
jgi:hypothetical protein